MKYCPMCKEYQGGEPTFCSKCGTKTVEWKQGEPVPVQTVNNPKLIYSYFGRIIALAVAFLLLISILKGLSKPKRSVAQSAQRSVAYVASTPTPAPTYTPLPTYTPYPTQEIKEPVMSDPDPTATPAQKIRKSKVLSGGSSTSSAPAFPKQRVEPTPKSFFDRVEQNYEKEVTKTRVCYGCKGTGRDDCIFCVDGLKRNIFNGEYETCEHCNGEGSSICTLCNGIGER
jgi:hypothetical protein